VIKAYDLGAFDPLDQLQMLAEAEAAHAVSDLNDVVTTHRAGTVAGWLVIEMDRLGESIQDYLDATAAGQREAISPQRWGVLFERAALALDAIHGRGLTHHDFKPGNVMFDRRGEHLVIADFSVADKRARRFAARPKEGAGPADVRGTNRYIAPEQYSGRAGPRVDQYAFAVTARDVLGDEIPEQAKRVLLRATSQDPSDRFATVADFGRALREALDDTVPRRVSSRLQRVSPVWRHAWGPGAWAAIAAYVFLIAVHDPGVTPREALLLPLVLGLGITSITASLSGHRATRTQPRASLADRSWFPMLLFGALAAILWPIVALDVGANKRFIFYAAGVSLVTTSRLGSVPRTAGDWLIGIVRRWERRRDAHRGDARRWWGVRVAILLVLVAIAWLPAAVGGLWPRDPGVATADRAGPLALVADARAAMLADRPLAACRLTRVPASSDKVACTTWVAIASRWLKAESHEHRASVFMPAQLRDIFFRSQRRADGILSWELLRGSGKSREYLGDVSREHGSHSWEVTVTRAADRRDPLKALETVWKYEVTRTRDGWALTAVEVCDFTVADPCVTLSQVRRSERAGVVHRGPPG